MLKAAPMSSDSPKFSDPAKVAEEDDDDDDDELWGPISGNTPAPAPARLEAAVLRSTAELREGAVLLTTTRELREAADEDEEEEADE
jgi:hypothetical protein